VNRKKDGSHGKQKNTGEHAHSGVNGSYRKKGPGRFHLQGKQKKR